jgi:hypothetical protein
MKSFLGCALALCALLVWILPGCSSSPAASPVLCQPSQLVRCNSCPMTGQCADTVCRGWLQCSADGTEFEGSCSECAPDDTNADSCASLQTCCAQSSLPGSERATCAGVVMANEADNCYALLNQYLDDHSCGGVANPPPPPPPDGGAITGACASLAPCCASGGNSTEAAGACSSLVSAGNNTACADATHLYCTHPGADGGGCVGSSCRDGQVKEASMDGGIDVTEPGDTSTNDVMTGDAGDGGFGDSGCAEDADSCDSGAL